MQDRGFTYASLSRLYLDMSKLDKAEKYILKSIDIQKTHWHKKYRIHFRLIDYANVQNAKGLCQKR